MSHNDITLDNIRTHAPSPAYDEGYDRIFGKKKPQIVGVMRYKDTIAARGSDLQKALLDGDMVKADRLYQEAEVEFRKYNPAYCPTCQGQGAVSTGITYIGSTLCEACQGTGYK